MANIEALIHKKSESDAQWKEQQTHEKQAYDEIREASLAQVTSDPALYLRYLQAQAKSINYRPGNVAMAIVQNPELEMFGTAEYWKRLGRSVISDTDHGSVKIYARAKMRKGYELVDIYDVSQTQGKPLKETCLQEGSKEMETALATLLNYSKAPVVTDREIDSPAIYDANGIQLRINPDYDETELFPVLAAEIAHSRYHNKGYNQQYNREESNLDAESFSYLLCAQLGIPAELPDASEVEYLYEGWDKDSISQALEGIQDLAKKMSYQIEQGIEPEVKGRKPITHQRA